MQLYAVCLDNTGLISDFLYEPKSDTLVRIGKHFYNTNHGNHIPTLDIWEVHASQARDAFSIFRNGQLQSKTHPKIIKQGIFEIDKQDFDDLVKAAKEFDKATYNLSDSKKAALQAKAKVLGIDTPTIGPIHLEDIIFSQL